MSIKTGAIKWDLLKNRVTVLGGDPVFECKDLFDNTDDDILLVEDQLHRGKGIDLLCNILTDGQDVLDVGALKQLHCVEAIVHSAVGICIAGGGVGVGLAVGLRNKLRLQVTLGLLLLFIAAGGKLLRDHIGQLLLDL